MKFLDIKETLTVFICVLMLGLAGCSDGTAEEAGEDLDEAIEDVKEGVDDACDKATDSNC